MPRGNIGRSWTNKLETLAPGGSWQPVARPRRVNPSSTAHSFDNALVSWNCSRDHHTVCQVYLIHWSDMFKSSQGATVAKPVALIAIDDPSTHSHSPSSRLNRHMGHIIGFRLLLLVETFCSNFSSFRQTSARGQEASIIIPSNDSCPSFALTHRYRRPSETEHWNTTPGCHSCGALLLECLHDNLFVQKFDRMSVLRSLSSLNTKHTERETRPDAARRRDTRCETSIRRRLTSSRAKEAAGCLLSSQSKPVTRNGTVDGDSPAPALGRRFPHDRLGARVEGRWSRAGPAARFEAAATVPGTTSVTRTRPFGGSVGRARSDPTYGNPA